MIFTKKNVSGNYLRTLRSVPTLWENLWELNCVFGAERVKILTRWI